jgi:Zn-dependent protease
MTYLPPSTQTPSAEASEEQRPVQRRNRGIGAILAALLAALLKFKFVLLFGVKLFGVSWSFLLSLWIYVVIFGWKLAVVIMLLLLAHELGHYFAFRAYGLPARLPAFIPLLGAFTAGALPDDLEQDAYIALAGPLTGLGLAAACYAVGMATQDRFWFACADLSAFLNLFNMIPTPPFDGGRIIGALWPPLWIGGFVLFLGLAFLWHIPPLFIVLIGVLGFPAPHA